MRKIEVSREFLEEFDLIDRNGWVYNALTDIESCSTLKILHEYFFKAGIMECNKRILEFVEVWCGKAEYVAKEQLYHVNLLDTDWGYLYFESFSGEYYTGVMRENNSSKFKFTEQEIKAINEAYWHPNFLEKVEEVIK